VLIGAVNVGFAIIGAGIGPTCIGAMVGIGA
jgi:hypothetical protein